MGKIIINVIALQSKVEELTGLRNAWHRVKDKISSLSLVLILHMSVSHFFSLSAYIYLGLGLPHLTTSWHYYFPSCFLSVSGLPLVG